MTIESTDILDMTLDDLEDMPTFEPYPAGAHRALVTLETKVVNDVQAVEAKFKLMENLELAEPLKDGVKPLEEGAETSVLCQLNNEWGRGTLKMIATPIGQMLGIASIKDVIEECNDIEVIIVSTVQIGKKDGIARTKIKELATV